MKDKKVIPYSNSSVSKEELEMVAFRVMDETFQFLDWGLPVHEVMNRVVSTVTIT